MTRQEWLKGIKVGDRVQAVSEEYDAKNPGIVVDVDEDFIAIYESDSRDLKFYSADDGAMARCDWRIEPLPSEWRKEPPDEDGWWWAWMNVPAELGYQVEAFDLERVDGSLSFRVGGQWHSVERIDARWQKANVPAPPVEIENA